MYLNHGFIRMNVKHGERSVLATGGNGGAGSIRFRDAKLKQTPTACRLPIPSEQLTQQMSYCEQQSDQTARPDRRDQRSDVGNRTSVTAIRQVQPPHIMQRDIVENGMCTQIQTEILGWISTRPWSGLVIAY